MQYAYVCCLNFTNVYICMHACMAVRSQRDSHSSPHYSISIALCMYEAVQRVQRHARPSYGMYDKKLFTYIFAYSIIALCTHARARHAYMYNRLHTSLQLKPSTGLYIHSHSSLGINDCVYAWHCEGAGVLSAHCLSCSSWKCWGGEGGKGRATTCGWHPRGVLHCSDGCYQCCYCCCCCYCMGAGCCVMRVCDTVIVWVFVTASRRRAVGYESFFWALPFLYSLTICFRYRCRQSCCQDVCSVCSYSRL